MSRALSDDARAEMFAQETGEVYIVLVTVSHDELDDPLRVCSDGADTVSRGDTFVAYPFNLELPSDEEGAPPRATISIDNVERSIAESLRTISSPATFLIEVVRAADPDTVEVAYDQFQLTNVKGDVFQISGDLTVEDMATEPFPYLTFSPARFPGLFS